MKIVVLVKEVPDTYGDRKLDLETGLADRGAGGVVLDEISERAVEFAVSYAEKNSDAEVVLLSAAPSGAVASIRKGLAIGATRAVHVVDEALRGADLTLTAEVLAAAISRNGFDLIIAGNQSTDGTAGLMPAMIAEWLGVAHATMLAELDVNSRTVSAGRVTDTGVQCLSVELPAVVSITEALPAARFPNFKGIMAAKKKPYETLSLADLGVDVDAPLARSIMTTITPEPLREAGVTITDDGDAGEKLAEFLIQNRFA